MANPFTIRIFMPEGDPEGIRIIDRLSSTGMFLTFPRNKWSTIRNRSELRGAGIYVLSGYSNPEDELPTIYIGQADTVSSRIEQHMKTKEFWDMAVVFVSDNKINATHAKWLEHALIKRLIDAGRSKVENGNSPLEPTISEAEKAEMNVFLNEIYQTLPLVGLRAFEHPRTVAIPKAQSVANIKNTIIVPAQEEGFKRVFLGENSWYAIRIAGGMLDRIKYIASYRAAPISGITHYAPIDRIEPYGEEGKYKLIFSEPAKELESTISFDLKKGSMQGPRYTSYEKLSKSSKMSELF